MSMMKRAFFEIPASDAEYIWKRLERHETYTTSEPFDIGAFPEAATCEVLSPFIHSRLDESALHALPKLRMIATRSTGYDHVDINYCRAHGITVSNVPVYGDNTVAEHTFALILALSRKVIQAHNRARTGDFSLSGLQGFDLRNRVLGVVGTGHIGTHVIRIARGFMMKVIAMDSRPDKRLADALDFEFVDSLDALLSAADIVTLHVPLLPSTRHLINAENIYQMKKGALLINTARGELVDTYALLEALDRGHIGGAGLDVFEGEGLIDEEKLLLSKEHSVEELRTLLKNLVLFRNENVIVTPHVAFNSREALERILSTTVDNIIAFERGRPINVVT
ncbi:MAG: hydroxyacid dehydrogenase [Acidobacteria bacterium]|nr:hydroxyacid dehydrogenase [Acidobacteriota bacterium]